LRSKRRLTSDSSQVTWFFELGGSTLVKGSARNAVARCERGLHKLSSPSTSGTCSLRIRQLTRCRHCTKDMGLSVLPTSLTPFISGPVHLFISRTPASPVPRNPSHVSHSSDAPAQQQAHETFGHVSSSKRAVLMLRPNASSAASRRGECCSTHSGPPRARRLGPNPARTRDAAIARPCAGHILCGRRHAV
jgi:hypothetical protein